MYNNMQANILSNPLGWVKNVNNKKSESGHVTYQIKRNKCTTC